MYCTGYLNSLIFELHFIFANIFVKNAYVFACGENEMQVERRCKKSCRNSRMHPATSSYWRLNRMKTGLMMMMMMIKITSYFIATILFLFILANKISLFLFRCELYVKFIGATSSKILHLSYLQFFILC